MDDINIEDIPGLFSIDGYLDVRDMEPPEIVDNIIIRLQGIRIDREMNGFQSPIGVRDDSAPLAPEVSVMRIRKKIPRPDPTRSVLDITRDTMRLR